MAQQLFFVTANICPCHVLGGHAHLRPFQVIYNANPTLYIGIIHATFFFYLFMKLNKNIHYFNKNTWYVNKIKII